MKKLIYLLVLVILVSGCATIFKDKMAEISLTSEPDNARIYINGNPKGRTPTNVKVPDKKPVHVLFHKEGYEDRIYTIGTQVQKRWACMGCFVPYFIPIIVDASTGNWNTLSEKEIHGVLEPLDAEEQKINNSLPLGTTEGGVLQ